MECKRATQVLRPCTASAPVICVVLARVDEGPRRTGQIPDHRENGQRFTMPQPELLHRKENHVILLSAGLLRDGSFPLPGRPSHATTPTVRGVMERQV